MTIKSRTIRSKTWRYRVRNGVWQTSTSRSYEQVDAVFHRVKPPGYSVTPLKKVVTNYNFEDYTAPGFEGSMPVYQQAVASRSATVPSFPSGTGARVDLEARSGFTESVMSGGEFLGQIGQTYSMVARRTFQVVSLFSAIRRGDWRQLEKQFKPPSGKLRSLPYSKRLASGYLEYHFGWAPLLSDIHSSMEALSEKVRNGSVVHSSSFQGYDYGSSTVQTVKGLRTGYYSRYRGIVSDKKVRNMNAFGLANPALTAWELLPFSFVIDWFLPISPILANLTASLGLSDVAGYGLWSRISSQQQYRRSVGGPWIPDQTVMAIDRLVATVGFVPPLPSFTMNPFDSKYRRALSALALIETFRR